ncbi:MAG: helix-turn-helix domain-containing protein [Micromonosporaceae bacterium]
MAEHIGGRVRVWRARRGLSQTALAGLAGVSQGYISQIEAGVKGVVRRSTLVALASALRVSVADLLGQPGDPTNPIRAKASEAVAAIRVALVELEAGEVHTPRRNREEIAAAIAHNVELRRTSDYLALAPRLPDLLRDAVCYRGTDALTRVAYEASVCLRNLGYRDLSWPAAKLAVSAANELGAPAWIGAANFVYTLSLPVEAAGVAQRVGERSAAALQQAAADPRARQMLGQVHLSAAHASAVAKRIPDVDGHLAEASAEADTLGDPTDAGFNLSFFGPTNVRLWKMSIFTELADLRKGHRAGSGTSRRHDSCCQPAAELLHESRAGACPLGQARQRSTGRVCTGRAGRARAFPAEPDCAGRRHDHDPEGQTEVCGRGAVGDGAAPGLRPA